jgi:(p)ppGpp synthase/HD superfamily hydrolase
MNIIASRHSPAEARLIEQAYEVAAYWHRGQRRKSGDPYLSHPVAVATTVSKLGADVQTICAALLHDVLEDTECDVDDLREQFGEEITRLVLETLRLDRTPTTPVDRRALTVKLADRLHNMQTLRYVDAAKQVRKSVETLHVLVPLADSLGLAGLRNELERLALARLRPNRVLVAGSALLPRTVRTRWLEEWMGELHILPTKRARARFALEVLRGLPRLVIVLRGTRP